MPKEFLIARRAFIKLGIQAETGEQAIEAFKKLEVEGRLLDPEDPLVLTESVSLDDGEPWVDDVYEVPR